jgi:hypothetical protein
MSCGPAEGAKALAAKVDAVNDKIDSVISDAQQGIASQVSSLKSTIQGEVNGMTDSLKKLIPEIPKVPDSLQNDVTKIVKTLLTGKLVAADLANDLKNLEKKWGSLDLGDINLNNLPQLLRSGALDLESICKKIPNLQKEGVDVIIKGAPVTFPEIDAVSIIRGGNIPKVIDPIIKVDIARAKREAGEKYLNIVKPRFGGD